MTTFECRCGERHEETAAVDYKRPLLPGRCSAQIRQAGGKWRVCHADLKLHGPVWRPDQKAQVCAPCTGFIQGRVSGLQRAVLLNEVADRQRPSS